MYSFLTDAFLLLIFFLIMHSLLYEHRYANDHANPIEYRTTMLDF